MDTVKNKTKIYLLIFSLIMSLMGVAFMKSSQGRAARGQKAAGATQALGALEKAAPKSPEMDRFLQREKADREANQEAGDMAK